jgi:hypothetical protein
MAASMSMPRPRAQCVAEVPKGEGQPPATKATTTVEAVRGVAGEVLTATVVDGGGARIGVTGRDLDVA